MTSETTLTLTSREFFRRGDRVTMSGRRAVVRRVCLNTDTLTIAWRDAWYWRLVWWCEDQVARFRRALSSTAAQTIDEEADAFWGGDVPKDEKPPEGWTPQQQLLIRLYALAAALTIIWLCVEPFSKP